MSKGNRRVKNVSGHPAPGTYAQDQKGPKFPDNIDFSRAWAEARIYDSSLPVNPPKNLPEEAQRGIILLARRVLKLESEWS
jgi:hypothetical protein